MVLVICDAAASRTQALTYLVGSLVPVLEGLLVIFVVSGVLMGSLLPESTSIGPLSPASLAIAAIWLGGVWLLNNVRKRPAWKIEMPGSRPGRRHHRQAPPAEKPMAARRAIALFAVASLVTLVSGVVLEVAGNHLADRASINGVIFGATILA